ncbi:MAG: sulfite exporter TauE/SafE family protein, partial [Gammaproteobacteria bacterium]|nr:sulfite exporter TauE/SafE family protein [Gammaproteobacteria bacterium]
MEPLILSLLGYLGTGAVAGLLAGLLGIGGGLVIVPALAALFALQGFPNTLLMHFA